MSHHLPCLALFASACIVPGAQSQFPPEQFEHVCQDTALPVDDPTALASLSAMPDTWRVEWDSGAPPALEHDLQVTDWSVTQARILSEECGESVFLMGTADLAAPWLDGPHPVEFHALHHPGIGVDLNIEARVVTPSPELEAQILARHPFPTTLLEVELSLNGGAALLAELASSTSEASVVTLVADCSQMNCLLSADTP